MIPRPYQSEALSAIEDSLQRVDRTLFCLPTGTGKTVVFAMLIDKWRDAGKVSRQRPAIVLAHREELLTQATDKISAFDDLLSIGLERADSRAAHGSEVIVASIQTVGMKNSRRLSYVTPSLIIVDEAHHAVAGGTYNNALRRWGAFDSSGVKTVGCTATPKRLDRKAIHSLDGAMFEEVAFHYSLRQAVKDQWLCALRGYRVTTDVDLDNVGTVGADFNEGQLADAVDQEARTIAAINRWKDIAGNRKTIVFCVNVEHAKHAAQLWKDAGFPAQVVHGKMGHEERSVIMGRFRTGLIQVLCNCQIATEGFDVPDVSSIVMLRPTKSWTLYVQMAGRGTRICEGKPDCIILDVVDNTTRHNLATVPAILDLPSSIDLQGATLEEAAKKMERLGTRGQRLLLKHEELKPRTLDEVDSMIERVDLLESVDPPSELQGLSSLAWIELLGGGYLLACGSGREVRLIPDTLGKWNMEVRQGPGVPPLGFHAGTDDISFVVQKADGWVNRNWSDAIALVNMRGRWRRTPPTEKQLKMLVRMGLNPAGLPNLTKGQASALISRELSKR